MHTHTCPFPSFPFRKEYLATTAPTTASYSLHSEYLATKPHQKYLQTISNYYVYKQQRQQNSKCLFSNMHHTLPTNNHFANDA